MEEIQKEVELDCEPERAWRALTDEDELSEWLGGEVEADLKPGGEITVREEDGERRGFFETIEPGRELSFWWSRPGDDESSRVEVRLEPSERGEGCVVRVTESRPMIALERELMEITGSHGESGAGGGPVAAATLCLA